MTEHLTTPPPNDETWRFVLNTIRLCETAVGRNLDADMHEQLRIRFDAALRRRDDAYRRGAEMMRNRAANRACKWLHNQGPACAGLAMSLRDMVRGLSTDPPVFPQRAEIVNAPGVISESVVQKVFDEQLSSDRIVEGYSPTNTPCDCSYPHDDLAHEIRAMRKRRER